MNLLLDSHALIWALHDPKRLSAETVREIRNPARAVFFSAASAWEIELKAARGKLSVPENWLSTAEKTGFVHLPVTAEQARASTRLPWHHTDPFDRMLVAQALGHGLRIVTRDPLIPPYGVPVLEA
ncbi:MAG: type II toxin-antitoxin system VapC family toxin [Gemmatimonadales bacterium]